MKIVNKENKFFIIFIKVIFILITNKKFFIKNISFPPSNIMKLNTIENSSKCCDCRNTTTAAATAPSTTTTNT